MVTTIHITQELKKKTNEVEDDDEKLLEIFNKKYVKAKEEETKFNDGDIVRFVINRKAFEKRSLPKWSKQTHKIVSHTEHTYTLDNGRSYKYYELQLVKDAEHILRPSTEPTREELRKQKTSERRFNKEGLDKNMILD